MDDSNSTPDVFVFVLVGCFRAGTTCYCAGTKICSVASITCAFRSTESGPLTSSSTT